MIKRLQDIANEKLGFSFGESWRYSEDSLVSLLPILRKTSKKKNYLLLSEADKAEVRDTGQINRVEIYNGDTKPLYIRMGEMFVGKTQERTSLRSYVIMSKEKVQVEVRCIHASKGIVSQTDMKSGGVVPTSFNVMFTNASFNDRGVDQQKVWGEVTNFACSMKASMDGRGEESRASTSSSASPSSSSSSSTSGFESVADSHDLYKDDLKTTLDNFSEQINHILEKVPHFDNQVGIATLDLKGVAGIECFDVSKSWESFRDAIIKKEGENLSKEEQDSPFEYKKGKAVKSVKKTLLLDYEEKTVFKSKDCRVIAIKANGYVGEVVEYKSDMIHLSIIRK